MEDPNESYKKRMEANYLRSLADPGRYSPVTRAGLQEFHDVAYGTNAKVDRMRAAELEMLKQQGLNAIGVEQAKAKGLEFQGAEAARIKGAADVQTAQIGADSAKGRWGYFENGKYIPGSEAVTAEKKYQSDIEQARLEREARIEAARIGGDWHREAAALAAASRENAAKTAAEGRTEAATITSQGRAARSDQRTAQQEQRDFDNWVVNVGKDFSGTLLTPAEKQAFNSMTPEEKKALWMKKTGRTPSGAPAAQTRTWRDRYGQQ